MNTPAFHRVSKALADPRRFDILRAITAGRGEVPCKTLLTKFKITPATMSHHLKDLVNAGLIEGRKEAQCMYFTPCRDVLAAYRAELQRKLG